MRLWAGLMGAVMLSTLIAGVATVADPVPQRAAALTGSQFDPGNIISDQNFFNPNAMSASQVQSFIDSRVGSCASGAVCLQNLRVDTWTIPATPMCSTYQGAAGELASTIIYKVGKACGVSQAVLLVMLQKEQSLVTARAPSLGALSAAMGVGCYDNGKPCVGTYAGFFNQIFNGAYLLKRYTQPAGTGAGTPYDTRFDLRYPVGQTTNILYNPNTGCGTKPVTIANQATHALYIYTPYTPNAAALANLGGTGDACSSYGNRNFWVFYSNWFGDPLASPSPTGWLDSMGVVGNQITAIGWTIDPNVTGPINVQVTVDGGVAGTVAAGNAYPGLGTSFPGYGDNHGFSATVTAPVGTHNVCVTALNDSYGGNWILGCRQVTVLASYVPIGWLDGVTSIGTQLTARGWALDGDSAAPISVRMTVDGGASTTAAAGNAYPGLGRSYPGFGDNHGFAVSATTTAGSHVVCVTAVNGGPGGDRSIGCATVKVTTSSVPTGWLDSVRSIGTQVTAAGWAIDADTASPISVRVTVDGGSPQTVTAGGTYPGLGGSFPGYGDVHGFTASLSVPVGKHSICVTAVNDGAGGDRVIGCTTITVTTSSAPIGWLDAVSAIGTQVTANGWALDGDTTAPINAQLTVDGVPVQTAVAGNAYPGLGGSFPGFGDNHGFSIVGTATPGDHTICVVAVNDGAGGNHGIGCRTMTISNTSVPTGWLDSVSVDFQKVTLSGWAIDADTASPINVRVTVDGGSPQVFPASASYPNLGKSFPGYGDDHGFSVTVSIPTGKHAVCVVAVNDGAGGDRGFGCQTVTATSRPPIGWVDSVTGRGLSLTASGWAIDFDTTAPINVQVSVDGGAPVTAPANLTYPNLNTFYPGSGDVHGFVVTVKAPSAGAHNVCVTALNDGDGSPQPLGCMTADATTNNVPIGWLDSFAISGSTVTAKGWTIDFDTANPIAVKLTVDGTPVKTVQAADTYPNLGSIYPGSGDAHGFTASTTIPSGAHTVCVVAVNDGSGDDRGLGCSSFAAP